MATGKKIVSTRRAVGLIGGAEAKASFVANLKTVQNRELAGAKEIVNNIPIIINEGRDALNNIISAVPDIVSSAVSTATAALAKLHYSGTNGNFQIATEPIVITMTAYTVVDDNSENVGFPYYQSMHLANVTGFCLCENAKVELTCTHVEQEAVEALLNKGVYLE